MYNRKFTHEVSQKVNSAKKIEDIVDSPILIKLYYAVVNLYVDKSVDSFKDTVLKFLDILDTWEIPLIINLVGGTGHDALYLAQCLKSPFCRE